MLYWNTSLPISPDTVAGYDEATFNNQYRTYLDAARAACPTTNILATLDYANPNPAQMSNHLAKLKSMRGMMANNDVWITRGASWGQQVYTGETGSPALDYRGVVRYMEEIETPDMCGSRQTATPHSYSTSCRTATRSTGRAGRAHRRRDGARVRPDLRLGVVEDLHRF